MDSTRRDFSLRGIVNTRKIGRTLFPLAGSVALLGFCAWKNPAGTQSAIQNNQQRDWPAYAGSAEANHYSALTQINRSNVKHLTVAWTYDTGETGGLQTSPLVVHGVLYGLTPSQK